MVKINYASKIDKIRILINYWKRRNVSPLGKITIVKSLLLPLLINIFTVLQRPPPDTLQLINKLFLVLHLEWTL